MDLISDCKVKISQFRVAELKDVLAKLGLSKTGLKKDLVERLLDSLKVEVLSPNGLQSRRTADIARAVNIINDTFRKMRNSGTKEVVVSNVHPNPNPDHEDRKEMLRVCCPCGSTSASGSTIMCENPRCQVWQHVSCVLIPEQSMEQPENPSCFYCELCRIKKADPFWVTLQHSLPPVKLMPSGLKTDGRPALQITEKVFTVTKLNAYMLQAGEVDLQVWCLLLNDKVPLRMHWPLHAELVVNGVLVRVVNRQGAQLLGVNGRDDGCLISAYVSEGINKISLSMCDARVFCIGVRLAKRQTVEQVLSLIPREECGERFEAALARVRRCVGGDANQENAESDTDLEVIADTVTVSLRCPMGGSRIKVAGRFKPCVHMGGFDLYTFIELTQRSRKWQCPICLKNYAVDNIIIDPYFNRITSLLQSCGEDVTEVEIKPNGLWRAKGGGNFYKWHYADGSVYTEAESETKSEFNETMFVKQESGSENSKSLTIGIKRNRDGTWAVKKSVDEIPNVNISSNSGNEVDPVINNFEITSKDANVIVLSDSEENDQTENNDTIQVGASETKFNDYTPKGPDIIILSDSEENNETTHGDKTIQTDIDGDDDNDLNIFMAFGYERQ